MSTLVPFPARIVRPEWAEHVVSPMHDALSREERAEILADRPYAWLHVSRTPDDAPEGYRLTVGWEGGLGISHAIRSG